MGRSRSGAQGSGKDGRSPYSIYKGISYQELAERLENAKKWARELNRQVRVENKLRIHAENDACRLAEAAREYFEQNRNVKLKRALEAHDKIMKLQVIQTKEAEDATNLRRF